MYTRRLLLPSVLLSALALASCDDAVVPEASVALLEAVSPAVASASVDSEVAVAVRVRDGEGAPVVGALVQWSTSPGSGAIVSEETVRTDATGVATAVWRLGTTAGPQFASAAPGGTSRVSPADFQIEALPGPAVSASLDADSVLLSGVRETVFLAPVYSDAWGNMAGPGSAPGWSSSDTAVALVAPDGLVTATGYGTAWVAARLGGEADSLLVTVEPRGAITVSFDDGFRSAYENAIPVMRELGLQGNVGVYTAAVGWPDYMTELQLEELHDAGWSLTSHTVSHDTLTLLSPSEMDYELRASQAWLQDRGYRGSHIFIAPYHEFEDRERIASAGYYTAARGESSNRTDPDTLVSWRPDNPYRLTGMDADRLPYTTAEGRTRLRELLSRVVAEGAFLDLYFHRVPAENQAAVRETLEIVAEFGDRVLPYHELFPVFARTVR